MSEIVLSEITIYPVKSLGGIHLKEAGVEKKGLKHDRRFMLVDENNNFVTQRTFPKLALIKTTLNEEGIILENSEFGSILVPFVFLTKNYAEVKVWNSLCKVLVTEDKLNKILSDFLNISCKLVYMPEEFERTVSPTYDVLGNSVVSFADGYPFLLISQESLNDLNSKTDEYIPMDRFRTNLVFSGGTAFQEDTWKKISINGVIFHIVKPCERCVMTTVDQKEGKSFSKEPLKTLAKYRNINGKVIFGQNLLVENEGLIKVGDKVEILS